MMVGSGKYDINSLIKRRTCELVRFSKTQRMVGCKWIFGKKEGTPIIEELVFNARLVVKGFT